MKTPFALVPFVPHLLCIFFGCSTAPCTSRPEPIRDAATTPLVPSSTTVSASPELHPPPRSATPAGSTSPDDPAAPSRARIDWGNWRYFVAFPTSISENGDRIAAVVSIDNEGEGYYPEWLQIKDIRTDKIEQEIELIGPDMSIRLESPHHCRDNLAACTPEIQRRLDAANAILEEERWRPFPCISIYHSGRPERMGQGCEVLADLNIVYKVPRLIISRGESPIVTRWMPTWSPKYHKPACKGITIDTYVESVAFEPETGLFVVSLRFVGPEGNAECTTPVWDFHPIRLPMFRQKAPAHDGGTAEPLPDRDGGSP